VLHPRGTLCNSGRMLTRLRKDLIRRKVKERFNGNLTALAAHLNYDRSTVHRWLEGRLPRDQQGLLALAVALDIDPFALWDVSLDEFSGFIGKVARAVAIQGLSRFEPTLSFVRDFLVPEANWPPPAVAGYYRRQWVRYEFAHRPSRRLRNHYAAVVLAAESPGAFADPQVWHFAYRDVGGRGQDFWHQYGLVIRLSSGVILYNFAGLTDSARARPETVVETWFGEGAADFCVASLHPFRGRLDDSARVDSKIDRSDAVCFSFPGAVE
jgi:hypothetical protein